MQEHTLIPCSSEDERVEMEFFDGAFQNVLNIASFAGSADDNLRTRQYTSPLFPQNMHACISEFCNGN